MGSFPTRPFFQASKKSKNFTKRKNFNAYGLQKASIYNSPINEEKSWQRNVVDILEAKEEIFMAK